MRKVVLYELLSLDGVAERPDSFFTDWDEAMAANLAAVIGAQDAVVLGRRSYEEWADYWPDSQIEPFATFINGVAKHIATSAPLRQPWTNAEAIDGDVVAFVSALKEQPGGDIGVHASISLVEPLLGAGVVDECRFVIAPTVVGAGRRLLDGVPPLRLAPVRAELSPAGYLLADYRVLGPSAHDRPASL